ncbi:GNAT family N-acetyltransferase [Salinarimonas soli]|uniref:GNAT family N-acetyltransferase n=1 Tax=Salinarimonas soli TaxID=1638099 RepID=A0A5B2V9V3_9HYPH|nr:GNAT family N-acetyltransferase [Salinarimonas soli]KAA2235791.1 GNAT family N-acetyltransferase [Salinarimonas soli]
MLSGWLQKPPPQIGPVEVRHAERLAAIHAGAFARPWSAIDFERLLAERAVLADGLFPGRGDNPGGFVLSRRVLDEAEILTVALDPSLRGRRCAAPLLRRHLDALNARGVRRVHLEVDEDNQPALALYRRLGFIETGRRAGYYAKPDGSRATALTMSVEL